MKEISEEEKAMYIYALHIVLYTNDIALRAIKFLRPLVKDKDKESRKIFGALNKRVRRYDSFLYGKIGAKDSEFYADFNGYMDEIFDKEVIGLRRAANWIFRCNGYTDTEYLSMVEEIFSMTCLSISIANSYICGLKMNGARTFILTDFKLDEIQSIVNDFYDWTMFIQHKEKVLDLSKYKSIKKHFDKIKELITDREVFSRAYEYALEEEKKRNNKE